MASECYCPKCNHEYRDPWMLFGDYINPDLNYGELVSCKKCGHSYIIERVVVVEYRTKATDTTSGLKGSKE